MIENVSIDRFSNGVQEEESPQTALRSFNVAPDGFMAFVVYCLYI